MALSRDVYRELEDILGPGNISEDPAVLEGYAFQRVDEFTGWREEGKFWPSPEAVVLPGSTEEVQAIIKLCNRRRLKSLAFSTGYGPHNAVSGEGEILLDLRRMNRILDIDEKNMYIVVEPYVSFAQVQAEAQKRGLNCHVIGAGSNCSFLASSAAFGGTNPQAISHGWGGRNLLGVEWVLPTGEILRLGSLGSGAGWFSGDGPGSSLRGILRGAAGTAGGLGVFTKCAVHLHPWPGPTEMEIKGISPYYEAEVPPLFEYHICEFPSWEKWADAIYKIGEAGIAYVLHKTGGPGSHGATVTGSNNEYYEKWDELKQIPWASFAIVMAANSPREHEYQVKVLDKILDDTGGKISPLGEEPTFKKRDFVNMIKMCYVPRTAFRLTGNFACPLSGADSVEHTAMGLSLDKDFRKKYDERGILCDDGVNEMWGVPFDGAHWAIFECGHFFDPLDEETSKGAAQMMQEGNEIKLKTPLAPFLVMGGLLVKELGPTFVTYLNLIHKIKKTFDPNTVSDPKNYIPAEEK